jgi:hypothetical protein
MFFPIPSQPMDHQEESSILLSTGCRKDLVDTLLRFAEKYRQSISADNILKSRKLGSRSLVRIARRLTMFPEARDLHFIISQSLLAEFLPTMERLNLNTLLQESNILKKSDAVRFPRFLPKLKFTHSRFSLTQVLVLKETILSSLLRVAVGNKLILPLSPDSKLLRIRQACLPMSPIWTISTTTVCRLALCTTLPLIWNYCKSMLFFWGTRAWGRTRLLTGCARYASFLS